MPGSPARGGPTHEGPHLRAIPGGQAGYGRASKPAGLLEQEAKAREALQRQQEEREALEAASRLAAAPLASPGPRPGVSLDEGRPERSSKRRPAFVHEPSIACTTFLRTRGAAYGILETHAGLEGESIADLLERFTPRLRSRGVHFGLLVTQGVVTAVFDRLPLVRYEGLCASVTFEHTGYSVLGSTAELWKRASVGLPLLPPGGLSGFHGQALRWLDWVRSNSAAGGAPPFPSTSLEALLVTHLCALHPDTQMDTQRDLLPLPRTETTS